MDTHERIINNCQVAANGCLLWQGHTVKGYGQISVGGRKCSPHRLLVDAPKGSVVRHTCDTPTCMNPTHLKIGTQVENVQDRVDRGRCAHGTENGNAVLTAEDVSEIRQKLATGALTQEFVGNQYGVTQSTVSLIKHRRTWRDVS